MSSPFSRPRPGQRSRLPELSDVLMRRTRAPLDLYCFYIFLQQENAEDALDCWLDMQQHENLCRAYFKVSSIRHFWNLRVLTLHNPCCYRI